MVHEETLSSKLFNRFVRSYWRSQGYRSWTEMWGGLDFNPRDDLNEERKKILRKTVARKLEQMFPEHYGVFCSSAHDYAGLRDDIFPDLPQPADILFKQYKLPIETLERRIQGAKALENHIPWIIGCLTLVGGGIGAGYLGEYLSHNRAVAYASAALGGPVSACLSAIGTGELFDFYNDRLRLRGKGIQQQMEDSITLGVKEYIQKNK